jgi:hypothetical protein
MSAPAVSPNSAKLQINTTGAWRDVVTFDLDTGGWVLHHADRLFNFAHDPSKNGMSARIISPGDVAPLMIWKKATGWVEWAKRSQ